MQEGLRGTAEFFLERFRIVEQARQRQASANRLRTGAPMSVSKLFYRNGSGVQGAFGYLARPAPPTERRGLPRGLVEMRKTLACYVRGFPRASKLRPMLFSETDCDRVVELLEEYRTGLGAAADEPVGLLEIA